MLHLLLACSPASTDPEPEIGASVDSAVGRFDSGAPWDQGGGSPDAAEHVSHNLPSEMSCGEEVAVEVVVRNSGASTWTREDGFKLGAVDDEDPFAPTRVLLDEGDAVDPDSAHGFRFLLTAPSEPGAYLTDWRMVHEGVRWFGGALTHEIEVVCSGPTGGPPALDELVWLHSDISSWPQANTLSGVSLSDSQICMPNDGVHEWPVVEVDGTELVGNPWIVLEHEGTWYAATWEWLRPGQECKNRAAVNGDHIKQPPLDTWSPRSGETYWFMVSGLARFGDRNVEARTNLVEVVWP